MEVFTKVFNLVLGCLHKINMFTNQTIANAHVRVADALLCSCMHISGVLQILGTAREPVLMIPKESGSKWAGLPVKSGKIIC